MMAAFNSCESAVTCGAMTSAAAAESFRKEKIATLEQLKRALGTSGTMTVFRKLKELGYLSSYSHRGKYYTLHEIPDYDEQGLWDWHAVWFSRYGNLVETAREFVEDAENGVTARELESILQVECKRSLLKLYRKGQVVRVKIGGVQVYLSNHKGKQRSQKLCRRKERSLSAGNLVLAMWYSSSYL